MSCLRPLGVCILHWGHGHTWSHTPADCFCAERREYVEMLERKYQFLECIRAPRFDADAGKMSGTYLLVGRP
jgi:hypothetical protein